MSRVGAALQRALTGAVETRGQRGVEDAADLGPESEPILPERVSDDVRVAPEPVPDQTVEEPWDGFEGRRFHAFNEKYIEKLVVSASVGQPLREQYRRLSATLHHTQEEKGLKTLMVTSAVPDEGKTLTATNIALTLSESYRRRVLLIDADLRRPSLDELFMLPKGSGLNEALNGRHDKKVPIIQVSKYLSLLPAGAPDPDPMSTLTSDRMRRLLAEAAAAFEWVIIDTPPIGILTDAKLMGTMVDGALLVIRSGRTPSELVKRSVDALGRNRIVGVVLNRADRRQAVGQRYYGYDYYYYSSYYGSKKAKS